MKTCFPRMACGLAISRHLALVAALLAWAAASRADILYVAGGYNDGTITKISSSGTKETFATTDLTFPSDLAFNSTGLLYASNDNSTIFRFNSSGGGSLFADFADGLNVPTGLAFDGAGDLYTSNLANETITRLTPGGVGSLFADSSDGLNNPLGLAFDAAGNLYAASYGNNRVYKFTIDGVGTVFADSSDGLSSPRYLVFRLVNSYT